MPGWPGVAAEAYEGAVRIVSVVTKRPRAEFPAACPFTVGQLLDEEFLP
jgi:Domain of unknown function DUF29